MTTPCQSACIPAVNCGSLAGGRTEVWGSVPGSVVVVVVVEEVVVVGGDVVVVLERAAAWADGAGVDGRVATSAIAATAARTRTTTAPTTPRRVRTRGDAISVTPACWWSGRRRGRSD